MPGAMIHVVMSSSLYRLEDTKISVRGVALLDEVSREGLEVTYPHYTQGKKLHCITEKLKHAL